MTACGEDYVVLNAAKATGSNPLSPALNESAAKDWTSFVVDGNTIADEKISFTVSGGSVVIFGINLSGYRVDEQ